MSKIHLYSPIIHYVARIQTLKINYVVNGHKMYCTCVFFYLCVTHIWTRTVTELPTVKGFINNCMSFTILFYCSVFNANDIFFYDLAMITNELNINNHTFRPNQ